MAAFVHLPLNNPKKSPINTTEQQAVHSTDYRCTDIRTVWTQCDEHLFSRIIAVNGQLFVYYGATDQILFDILRSVQGSLPTLCSEHPLLKSAMDNQIPYPTLH